MNSESSSNWANSHKLGRTVNDSAALSPLRPQAPGVQSACNQHSGHSLLLCLAPLSIIVKFH